MDVVEGAAAVCEFDKGAKEQHLSTLTETLCVKIYIRSCTLLCVCWHHVCVTYISTGGRSNSRPVGMQGIPKRFQNMAEHKLNW